MNCSISPHVEHECLDHRGTPVLMKSSTGGRDGLLHQPTCCIQFVLLLMNEHKVNLCFNLCIMYYVRNVIHDKEHYIGVRM